MTLLSSLWPCLAVCGPAWQSMALLGSLWPCLAIYDPAWQSLTCLPSLCLCLANLQPVGQIMALLGIIHACSLRNICLSRVEPDYEDSSKLSILSSLPCYFILHAQFRLLEPPFFCVFFGGAFLLSFHRNRGKQTISTSGKAELSISTFKCFISSGPPL